MEIISISDTHGQHKALQLAGGDMIIHAGDVSGRGRPQEIADFLDWFSKLNFKHKIFIPGNHDFFFENSPSDVIDQFIPKGVTYLNDSGIEIEGVKIWGSPITPWFFDWAFNRGRGEEIKKHWNLIPVDTDILVTHGPPLGILDRTVGGELTGCEDLLACVQQISPEYHIFGHIHEGYGRLEYDKTTFINASVLDESYNLVNSPTPLRMDN
ncbi:MAG: metallophosphoesterase family protein [Sphingobacterium sp.]